jgi:hypothetical protein
MPVQILRAPVYEPIPERDPLLFLAGPIQGANDWQAEVIDHISSEWDSELQLHIASPRRIEEPGSFNYSEQVRWERHHLFRAMKFGAVAFWLARQDPELPYKVGRAYAQTTRFEFGMAYAAARLGHEPHISLGMEEGYKGSEKYYNDCAEELALPIYVSLEGLGRDALINTIRSSHA